MPIELFFMGLGLAALLPTTLAMAQERRDDRSYQKARREQAQKVLREAEDMLRKASRPR